MALRHSFENELTMATCGKAEEAEANPLPWQHGGSPGVPGLHSAGAAAGAFVLP